MRRDKARRCARCRFDDFVGQKAAIENLKVFVGAGPAR
jgi:Holliday junction resolvasome RuvABC ATP-dependent DNA helicase subunit